MKYFQLQMSLNKRYGMAVNGVSYPAKARLPV